MKKKSRKSAETRAQKPLEPARWKDPAATALVMIVLGASLWARYARFLSLDHPAFTIIQWDFFALFLPLQFTIDMMLAKGMPFWDHAMGCGYSLLKDAQGMYWHPGPLLVALVSRNYGELIVNAQRVGVTYVFISMVGVFFFCRRMGGSHLVSGAAALCAGLLSEGPSARLEVGQFNTLAGSAIIPFLALAAATRYERPRAWVPFAILAMTAWMILCGPHPQNTLGCIFVVLLVIVNAATEKNRESRKRLLGYWVLGGVGALLLTAPVWIAQLQGLRESGRVIIGEELGASFSREAMKPLTLFRQWFVPFAKEPIFVEGNLYVGLSLTFLCMIALAMKRTWLSWSIIGVAVFSLIYSMGNNTPFYHLLRHAGVFAPSGLPPRTLMFFAFFLPAAFAWALKPDAAQWPSARILASIAAGVLAVGLLASGREPVRLLLPGLLFLATVAAILSARLGKLPQQAAILVVCLAVCADLGWQAMRMFDYHYPKTSETESAARALRASGSSGLAPRILSAYDASLDRTKVRTFSFGWNPAISARFLRLSGRKDRPAYDRQFAPIPSLQPILNVHSEFAYLYRDWKIFPDYKPLLETAHSPQFDPNILLLDEQELGPTGISEEKGNEGAPRVAIPPQQVALRNDEIEINATNDAPAFLFVSMAWDPDWQVTVDGEKTLIVPAYHALTALPLQKPGAHRVVMVYKPIFMTYGFPLQILWLAGFAAWLGWIIKKRFVKGRGKSPPHHP